MSAYVSLGIAIFFNVIANVFIKIGVNRLLESNQKISWLILVKTISQPFLLLGIFSFGLALLAYAGSLSRIPLHIAYPIFVSLGIVFVSLLSSLFLKETIIVWQYFGLILIFLGIFFLTR